MIDTPKTIGFLISSFLPNLGGIEVGLHNIAMRVQKLGYKAVIFAPYEHVKLLREQGWNLPYEVVALPPKMGGIIGRAHGIGFAMMRLYLGYMAHKYKIAFWHVTMGYPMGCAMVDYAEKSKTDVQYLIRCAGEDIQKQPDIGYGMRLDPKLDTIISAYLSRAQRLVAITPSVRAEYEALNVPDARIFDIPNGVAVDRFEASADRAQTRAALGLSDEDTLILSVGRNHPKKNYKALIEAGRLLKEQGRRKFKIICVGKGCADLNDEGLGDYLTLIDGMDSPNQDNLQLPVDELVRLYKAADIFAFPSLMETFGIAIVEAMAAGLPVIVGDSEGCRDIVQRGKWGLMCDPNDPNDLADKLTDWIENPEHRTEWVQKSKIRAQDFDWNTIALKYADLYES